MVHRERIVKITTKNRRSHSKKIFEARGDERHSSNTLSPLTPFNTIPSTTVLYSAYGSTTIGSLYEIVSWLLCKKRSSKLLKQSSTDDLEPNSGVYRIYSTQINSGVYGCLASDRVIRSRTTLNS